MTRKMLTYSLVFLSGLSVGLLERHQKPESTISIQRPELTIELRLSDPSLVDKFGKEDAENLLLSHALDYYGDLNMLEQKETNVRMYSELLINKLLRARGADLRYIPKEPSVPYTPDISNNRTHTF